MTALASRLLAFRNAAESTNDDEGNEGRATYVPVSLQTFRDAMDEAAAALSGREAVAFWHDGDGRAISDAEKTRSCRGDVDRYHYPLFTTPPPGDGWVLHGRVNGYLPRQQAIEIHADAPLPDWLTSVRDLRVTVAAAPSAKGVANG